MLDHQLIAHAFATTNLQVFQSITGSVVGLLSGKRTINGQRHIKNVVAMPLKRKFKVS